MKRFYLFSAVSQQQMTWLRQVLVGLVMVVGSLGAFAQPQLTLSGNTSNLTVCNPDASQIDKAFGTVVVSGDNCSTKGETAFAGSTNGSGSGCNGNSGGAWYMVYGANSGVQTLWAGQDKNAGTVEIIGNELRVTLASGWQLNPATTDPVKFEGYSSAPTCRPSGKGNILNGNGQTYLVVGSRTSSTTGINGNSYTYTWPGDNYPYYTIHVDVQLIPGKLTWSDGSVVEDGCERSQTRTFTYTNCEGSFTKASTVSWTVDNDAPVISTTAVNGDLGCNPTVTEPVFTVTEGCSEGLTAVVTTTGPSNVGCNYTQTWKANVQDKCGNPAEEVSITYSWTVDKTAPVLSGGPAASMTICQGSTPTITLPTATDNCSGSVSVTYKVTKNGTDVTAQFTQSGNGILVDANQSLGDYVITFSATDACGGNTSTSTTSVKVKECCDNTTYSQGGWSGNPKARAALPNVWNRINAAFGMTLVDGSDNLVIGNKLANKSVTLAQTSIAKFMPNSGTPAALTRNWTNPTSRDLKNTLAGQFVAMILNITLNDIAGNPMSSFIIQSGPFAGKQVKDLADLTNKALGGTSVGYSFSALNQACEAVNLSFHEGTVNTGFLSCRGNYNPAGRSIVEAEVLQPEPDTMPVSEINVNVTAYPNPYIDRVNIQFESTTDTRATVQIMSVTGSEVKTLFDGEVKANTQYSTEFGDKPAAGSMYIYRIVTPQGVKTGKLFYLNR